MVKVKIKRVSKDAVIPKYAHEDDAGVDLHSTEDYRIEPGKRVCAKTGLKVEFEEGYEMQIRPKSGLALKEGITLLNTPGTIDAGYRGEISVIIINHGLNTYDIKKGQKIAQAVFNKIEKADFIEVKELNETKRGEGGFGSTGLN